MRKHRPSRRRFVLGDAEAFVKHMPRLSLEDRQKILAILDQQSLNKRAKQLAPKPSPSIG